MISHVPKDNEENLKLIIFATDEIGDTPNSPCFVNATPKAAKNRLIINNTYRFVISILLITNNSPSKVRLLIVKILTIII